jgi:hypothetical protein
MTQKRVVGAIVIIAVVMGAVIEILRIVVSRVICPERLSSHLASP